MGSQCLAGPRMKQVAVIALVLVGCMEVSPRPAPHPFLLNLLLNHHADRRNGKAVSSDAYEVPSVNDAYGAPEVKDEYSAPEVKDEYGAPEVKDTYAVPDTSTSSSYEAPKAPSYTTTLAPCSYQPPTTAAPSYNTPKKHIFPDILGFLGNLIKPKKQQVSQTNCLTAPQESSYAEPQDTSYSAPQDSAYEAPEATSYEAPKEDSYKAPEAETYEAPKMESYEAPKSDGYEAPKESGYDAPEESGYSAPEKPTFIDLVTTYEEPESPNTEVSIAVNERSQPVQ